MHLENNTMVVKFINAIQNKDGSWKLNYQTPIKRTKYYWYANKQQQSTINVGDVIINQRGYQKQPHLAVVVDIQSNVNGQYHKPIGKLTHQNIKFYLQNKLHDTKFTNLAYQRYLEIINLKNLKK